MFVVSSLSFVVLGSLMITSRRFEFCVDLYVNVCTEIQKKMCRKKEKKEKTVKNQ